MIDLAKWVAIALVYGLAGYLIYRIMIRPHAMFCIERKLTRIGRHLEMLALKNDAIREDPALPIVLHRARSCAACLTELSLATFVAIGTDKKAEERIERADKLLSTAHSEIEKAHQMIIACAVSAYAINSPVCAAAFGGVGIMTCWIGSVRARYKKVQRKMLSRIDRDDDCRIDRSGRHFVHA